VKRLSLIALLLLVSCTQRGEPQRGGPPRKTMPDILFNEASYNLGLAVRWHDKGDGKIEEGELSGYKAVSEKADFVQGRPNPFLQRLIEKITWFVDNKDFYLKALGDRLRLQRILERIRRNYETQPTPRNRQAYRRALRNIDLATRRLYEIEVDFSRLPLPDQQAIRVLLDEAIPHLESIYLTQMDPKNLLYREEIIERGDPEDLFAFYQMGGVVCLTQDISPHCSSHPDTPSPTPNQGLWPPEFTARTVETLLKALPTDEEGLKSPFVIRKKESNKLAWQSLNDYPPTQKNREGLIEALRKAASFQGMNESIARFLQIRTAELADVSKPYPFFDGDIAWINTNGPWDLTLGYYEEYHSPFQRTAIMEAFIGVVDRSRESQGEDFRNLLPWMEDQIASYLGPAYLRRNFSTLPPLRFVDTVSVGDARSRFVTIAFYLPNVRPHGRGDLSKKVILVNKSIARFKGTIRPLISLVMDPDQIGRLHPDDIMLFVVGHENAHGAGPGRSYQINGEKTTSQDLLLHYSVSLEEARADLLGLGSLPEMVRRGIISKEQADHAAIGMVAMLMRGLAMGEEDDHGKAALLTFPLLLEQGAIRETTDGKYAANLDERKIFKTAWELGQQLNRIQATGNFQECDALYRHAAERMPLKMKEEYLPKLREMPRDLFPYYRFKFSS